MHRLRELREFLELGQEAMSKVLEVEQSTYSRIERGISGLTTKHTLLIKAKYPNVNTEWLNGLSSGPMLIGSASANLRPLASQNFDPLKISSKNTPEIEPVNEESVNLTTLTFIPFKAVAGLMDSFTQVQYSHELPKIKVPGFGNCDTAIEMEGDSMYPSFASGDTLLCKKLTSAKYIDYGYPYVVYLSTGSMIVKRVFPHNDKEEKVVVKSDNDFYPPYTVDKEDIKGLFVIKGFISKNTGQKKLIGGIIAV